MTTKKLLALAALQRELNLVVDDLVSCQADYWTTVDRLIDYVIASDRWLDEALARRETVQ